MNTSMQMIGMGESSEANIVLHQSFEIGNMRVKKSRLIGQQSLIQLSDGALKDYIIEY